MKRDMDLVRQVLLKVEEATYDENSISIQLEGYSEGEISYQVMILDEAGLIKAEPPKEWGERNHEPIRLTWQGHEFLDAARDQNRWNQAKRTISEKGGSLTFDVLKAVLSQLARQAVNL